MSRVSKKQFEDFKSPNITYSEPHVSTNYKTRLNTKMVAQFYCELMKYLRGVHNYFAPQYRQRKVSGAA